MNNEQYEFRDTYSAEGFKYWFENDETIQNRTPHTSERYFANDNTDEDNIAFLVEDRKLTRIASLGAIDMPTPFRSYNGVETRKMGFPYFLEGWHSVQEETRRIARIMKNSTGNPTEQAVKREVLRLYRRTDEIITGMLDVAEVMRMQMLQNCAFMLQNAEQQGGHLYDLYNYDIDGTWARDHIEVLSGTDAWSDTTNSDPIADLIRYDRLMKLKGKSLVAIMGSTATLNNLFMNEKIKNYAPFVSGVGASYILTNADVERIIETRIGHKISIVFNDEQYVGWDDTINTYMHPNTVILIGDDYLGTTWNGMTYEEAANIVHGGNAYKSQARLNNGIVVSDYIKPDPDEKVFRITRACIPSFEGMNAVYNLLWIDSATQYKITYDANGGTGATLNPQGVIKGEKMGYVAVGTLLTKNNKRFIGWNTSADGTGTTVDRKYVPTADTQVYAIYES